MSQILTWIAIISGPLGIITSLIVVYNFSKQQKASAEEKRRSAVEEGKKQQEAQQAITQLRNDLDRAYEKIRNLESCSQRTGEDLREIKTNIEWICKSLKNIEDRMDRVAAMKIGEG